MSYPVDVNFGLTIHLFDGDLLYYTCFAQYILKQLYGEFDLCYECLRNCHFDHGLSPFILT